MNDRLIRLLEAVANHTSDGRLQWQSFDDESFRVPVGKGYLHIQRGSTYLMDENEKEHPAVKYTVQVSDELGRVFEDAEFVGYGGGFALSDKVFRAARSSALNGDHVMDTMLDALGALR